MTARKRARWAQSDEEEEILNLDWTGRGLARPIPMNTRIWRLLPYDLLVRSLSFATMSTVLNCRGLSEQLHNSLTSKSFVEEHAERSSSFPSWILLDGAYDKCLNSFDAACGKWLQVSLDFLPGRTVRCKASGGGLLLCMSDMKEWFVCNPITRTWRKLPIVGEFDVLAAVIVNSAQPTSFKVFLSDFGDHDGQIRRYLYHSTLDSWEISTDIQQSPSLNRDHRLVPCHGDIFSIVAREVERYSMSGREWRQIELPGFCYPLRSRKIFPMALVECSERLYMVGSLVTVSRTKDNDAVELMNIWRLEEPTATWIEVARVPEGFVHHLSGRKATLCDAFGQGSKITLLGRCRSTMLVLFDLQYYSYAVVCD